MPIESNGGMRAPPTSISPRATPAAPWWLVLAALAVPLLGTWAAPSADASSLRLECIPALIETMLPVPLVGDAETSSWKVRAEASRQQQDAGKALAKARSRRPEGAPASFLVQHTYNPRVARRHASREGPQPRVSVREKGTGRLSPVSAPGMSAFGVAPAVAVGGASRLHKLLCTYRL